MKKLLIALMALMMLCVTALAETSVEPIQMDSSVSICRGTNCYVKRLDDGYHLFDAEGNMLSGAYKYMSIRGYGYYLQVENGSGSSTLNYLGKVKRTQERTRRPS